jgi:hypothetical protein
VGMSRPPFMKVAAARPTFRSLALATTGAKKWRSTHFAKITLFSLFALTGLSFLTGCQGVSAGGSNQQQQTTLSLNLATLQFGSVQAGTTKTLTFTASNSGPASVSVSGVSISSKYFTLTSPSLPVTVSAGQGVPVSVSFEPNAAGNFTATATITSDASDTSTTLSLSGTGTSNPIGVLASSPSSEAFGSVTDGSQQSQTFTLTNSGSASVNISQVSITGTGFQLSGITAPLTLASSQSTTFTVAFAPQAAGAVSGSVTITSDASNSPLTVGLTGTGVTPGSLTANPASLSFGSVTVGNNASLPETITNSGGASLTISQIAASTGFSLSGVTTPITLASGQNTSFHVVFSPTSATSASGTVTVTSDASNPSLSIPLSGTGTTTAGQLGVSPTTLALGSVVVGTSGSGSGTLTATGASVTITSASANNSAFSVSDLTFPVTITAGQSLPFSVTFTPTSAGAVSATLSFASDSPTSPTTETLTGTGEAAPTYDVALSWSASTSSNISGYNVYRSVYTNSTCGSFAKINPSLNASTSYTDSVVTDGTAYCYYATAMNSSNQESEPSNIVSDVQIPAP